MKCFPALTKRRIFSRANIPANDLFSRAYSHCVCFPALITSKVFLYPCHWLNVLLAFHSDWSIGSLKQCLIIKFKLRQSDEKCSPMTNYSTSLDTHCALLEMCQSDWFSRRCLQFLPIELTRMCNNLKRETTLVLALKYLDLYYYDCYSLFESVC